MGNRIPQTPIVVTGMVFAAQAPYSTSWLECAAGDLIVAPGGYRDILIREGVIDPGAALAAVGEVKSAKGKPAPPIEPEPEPEPEPAADDSPTVAPEGEDRMVREASQRTPARGRGRGRQGGARR